ncbi:MAG: hypothetical protein K0M56_11720 [Kaistella sp.]|nr:hypothetical protein [Kaistella sp.]
MIKQFLTSFAVTLMMLMPLPSADAQEIPVMAFHGVQKEYTSEANFKMLRAAGFNINFTVYLTNDEAAKALDCAQLAGVKILLFSAEMVRFPKETVLRFRNHPALYGYYVGDEPSTIQFNHLAATIKEIRKYDTVHPSYINLFPNYADNEQLKALSYIDYLHKFINTVPVDFISFDHYPLRNNTIHKDWYANIEMIKNVSLISKKNFWGFANATVFGPYKTPTLAGLKLQMYSNLLYGAKGLQYFTYWTLDDEYWRKNKFGHAIVDAQGLPTPTYALVKKVNLQIRKYAHVFNESKVTAVFHTDKTSPRLTAKLPAIPQNFKYFSATGPALVSYFTTRGKNYAAVLNKDIFRPMVLSAVPGADLKILDPDAVEKLLLKNKRYSINILPGDMAIFCL